MTAKWQIKANGENLTKGKNAMNTQKQIQRLGASVLMGLPEMNTDLAQFWIENPTALKKVLGNLSNMPRPEMKLWKSVRGDNNIDSILNGLANKGVIISDEAKNIILQYGATSIKGYAFNALIRLTVAELGFENGATYEQIIKRVDRFGLRFCGLKMAIQLRYDYDDQPDGERIIVMTSPTIMGLNNSLRVFRLQRAGKELVLHGVSLNPRTVLNKDHILIFSFE